MNNEWHPCRYVDVVKLWLNATILTFWMVVMIPWA